MYKRRHDINITINTKQIGCTDQTPTPTKLLRNCDEVGLFKDLNPFDETFQKAVEDGPHCKPRDSLVTITDDTLHTPNIFPIGAEFNHCKEGSDNGRVNFISQDSTKVKKKLNRTKKKGVLRLEQSTQCENNFVVLDKNVTFKLPIPKLPPSVKVVSTNTFSVLLKNTFKVKESNPRTNLNQGNSEDDKFNLLESNRLAQKRSREKRKLFYQELLQKNLELEEKVAWLMKENKLLKRKLEQRNDLQNRPNELSRQNAVIGIERRKNKLEADMEHVAAKTFIASSEILCLESCLPILETKESETASSNEISQVVLRKPFKKRDIHPKLYLSCKPVNTE